MKITAKKVMIIGAVLIFAVIITASAGCIVNVNINDVVPATPGNIIGSWHSDEVIQSDNGGTYDIEYTFDENNNGYKTSNYKKSFVETTLTTSLKWTSKGSGQYEIKSDIGSETEIFKLNSDTLIDGDGNSYHRV